MAETISPYNLQKPEVGSDNDQWGDMINGNIDKINDLLKGDTPVEGIDIVSGSIDGAVIGGANASAGTFTTVTATATGEGADNYNIAGLFKGNIVATDGSVILTNGTDGTDATFTGTASSLSNCTASGAELSTLTDSGMTATKMANLADLTVAEVDILDGATITTDELNHLANATSEIQTQIDGKQDTLTAGTNIDIVSSTIHASGCPDVIVDGTVNVANGIAVNSGLNIPVSNLILDQTSNASIVAGVINLPAGTYLYEGTAILRNTDPDSDVGKADLQLETDGGTGIGTPCSNYVGERAAINASVIGTFITDGDGFRLKATSNETSSRIKYGDANGTAVRQASTIKFWKIR